MLRPFTKIQIQQVTKFKDQSRDKVFNLDFVTEYEILSNWESHTNTSSIKFPKNIKLFGTEDGVFAYSPTFGDVLGGTGTLHSPNINAFGEDIVNPPLIMKGDIIRINHGYLFRNSSDQDNQCCTHPSITLIDGVPVNTELSVIEDLFFGYVSSIKSGTPIEIEIEDNFYLLKRTPLDITVWNKKESPSGNTALYDLVQHLLDLTNASFNSANPIFPKLELLNIPSSITAQLALGYLEIGDMTCGQLLDKLQQQYHFNSSFRGNVLQFGFPIYIDSELPDHPELQANSNNFFCFRDIFNEAGSLIASANIFPSHDLEYINKDDIVLSATVQCKVINPIKGKMTLSGKQKTFVERLKVLVYWDIVTSSFKYYELKTGDKVPKNQDGGERHQFYYPVDASNPNPKISDLVRLGEEQLKKYHYTGFHGCFTTFGFPFVNWNDNITILDPIYSDRNGMYKIKEVKYRGGLKGLSQEIHLDYKIDTPIPSNTKQVYML